MPENQQYKVVTATGVTGHVFRKSRFLDRSDHNRVVLDDGRELTVPASSLIAQSDGSFLLDDNVSVGTVSRDVPGSETAGTYPASTAVHRPVVETPEVRATSDSSKQEFMVDEALFSEEAGIERVPVGRFLDGPVETRQDGDVLIVPVVEEVLAVQKRLFLKEEIRITRKRVEVRQPRRVIMTDSGTRIIGSDGRDVEVHR